MSYTVILTDQARADLISIFKYIRFDLQSVRNAVNQLTRLEQAIASLDQMPERCRVYDQPGWRERNLRFMPVDNYLVFYIPEADSCTVTILRILYGGRDIGKLLEDTK